MTVECDGVYLVSWRKREKFHKLGVKPHNNTHAPSFYWEGDLEILSASVCQKGHEALYGHMIVTFATLGDVALNKVEIPQ